MDDAQAARIWNKYVTGRSPMVIMDRPDDFEVDSPIVVVPEADNDFLIADFSTEEAAVAFCGRNGLPIAENRIGYAASPNKP